MAQAEHFDALVLGSGQEVSEVFHDARGVYAGTDEPNLFGRRRVSGPDPEHISYRSFVFSYPDGNGWLLHHPAAGSRGGATISASPAELAGPLRGAEAAHGEREKRLGRREEG